MASRDVLRLDVLVVLWRWRWCLVCCMVCILKVVGISMGLRLYLCLRSSVELVVLLSCCPAVLLSCSAVVIERLCGLQPVNIEYSPKGIA